MLEFEPWPELARVSHDNEPVVEPPPELSDEEYEAACADAWEADLARAGRGDR